MGVLLEHELGIRFRSVLSSQCQDFLRLSGRGSKTKDHVVSRAMMMDTEVLAGFYCLVLFRSNFDRTTTNGHQPSAWKISGGSQTKRRGTQAGKPTIEIQRVVSRCNHWAGDLFFWPDARAREIWNLRGIRIFVIKIAKRRINAIQTNSHWASFMEALEDASQADDDDQYDEEIASAMDHNADDDDDDDDDDD